MSEGPEGELAVLVDQLLDAHERRFQGIHQRARVQAGPTLFGGGRGVEHWTYAYAHEALEDAAADLSRITLNYCPDDMPNDRRHGLARMVQDRFAGFCTRINQVLEKDRDGPATNEWGLKPSREALGQVARAGERHRAALAGSLAQRRMLPNPRRDRGLFRGLADRVGGSDRLILYVSIGVAAALMLWSFA